VKPLLNVNANSNYLFPPEIAQANTPHIRDGSGVAPRFGAGQGKTGYFFTSGKARQVILLLLNRSLMKQQLRGTE
jgi:hypothetical protein